MLKVIVNTIKLNFGGRSIGKNALSKARSETTPQNEMDMSRFFTVFAKLVTYLWCT